MNACACMHACKHLASTKARLLPCDTPARETLAAALLFLLFLILLLSETIHWIGSIWVHIIWLRANVF